MDSGFLHLLKPFDYNLTLTLKENQIFSTVVTISNNTSFTSKVLGLSINDYQKLLKCSPNFFLKRFSVDLLKKVVHFNKGLHGGGACSPLTCKKFEVNQIRKSIQIAKSKSGNLDKSLKTAKTLSKQMQTGKISKETLKKLGKINPIENNNQIEIFDVILSGFSNPATCNSRFLIEERHKISEILRNYFIFSSLPFNIHRNETENALLKREELLKNLIAQVKDRNSLEELGTLLELELIDELNRKEYWTKLIKVCPVLVKVVLGDGEEFLDTELDKCENFLASFNKKVQISAWGYLPLLLEFFCKNAYQKIFDGVDRRKKFVSRLLNGFKDLSDRGLGILLNFVLKLAENDLISDSLLNQVMTQINEFYPDFNDQQKLRCCFFMKVIKHRTELDIKSPRKIFYINVLENENNKLIKNALFKPKFCIFSLKTLKNKAFLKSHSKNYIDFAINKKDLFSDNKRVENIFKYFTQSNLNTYNNVFNIFGDRSMGKTSLVLNYMLKYQKIYAYIFFIRCQDRTKIISEFNKCCQIFNVDSFDSGIFGLEKNLNTLNSIQENVLIVLDDVQVSNDFHQLYLPNVKISYILTSKDLLVPISATFQTNNKTLKESSAISILCTYLNDFNVNTSDIKSQVVQMFLNNPEKIKLFASHLVTSDMCLGSDFLYRLKSIFKDFPLKVFQDLTEKTLKNPGKSLLKVLSYFEPEAIPMSCVKEIYFASFKSQDFYEGKTELTKTLLITEIQSNDLLFWNIEAALMDFISVVKTEEITQILLKYLNDKFSEDLVDQVSTWELIRSLLPHALKVIQNMQEECVLKASLCIQINRYSYYLAGRLPVDISSLETLVARVPNLSEPSEFELKYKLSLFFTELKLFPKAETYFARCLNLMQNNQSLNNSFGFQLCLQVGILYKSMGRYEKAESFFQVSKSIQSSSFKLNISQKCFFYQVFTDFYSEIGRFSESSANFEEISKISNKVNFQKTSSFFRVLYRNQAVFYLKFRNFEKCQQSLKFCLNDSSLEQLDCEKAAHFAVVGNMFLAMEDWEKAKEFHGKSARIRENLFGLSSPEMAEVYFAFGQVSKGLKRFSQAGVFFKRSLEIMKATYEENHLGLAEAYLALGEIEAIQKNFEVASVLYTKGCNLKNAVLEKNHPDFVDVYLKFGDYHRGLKDFQTAKQNYLNSLEIIENSFVDPNEDKAKTLKMLGIVSRDLGEYPESKAYLEECFKYRQEHFQSKPFELSEVLFELGCLGLISEDWKASLDYFQSCLSLRSSVFGVVSIEIGEVYHKLGKNLLLLDDLQNSQFYLNCCYEIYKQLCQQGDLKLADICFDLGKYELRQKNYNQAKDYLDYCLNIREIKLDKHDPDLADVYLLYGECLQLYSKNNGSESARMNPSLKEAKDWIHQSLNIYENNCSEKPLAEAYPKLAEAYFKLANIYNLLEEMSESEKFFIKSVKIIEKQFKKGDEKKIVDARMALAELYFEIKEFEKSEEQFLKIRDIIGLQVGRLKKESIQACKGLYKIYYYLNKMKLFHEIRGEILALDPDALSDED